MKKIISLVICVVFLFNLSACSLVNITDSQEKVTKTITAMNTVMQITVFNTSEGTNEDVLNALVTRIEELEKLFDPNIPESDVYKINNSKGVSLNEIFIDKVGKNYE